MTVLSLNAAGNGVQQINPVGPTPCSAGLTVWQVDIEVVGAINGAVVENFGLLSQNRSLTGVLSANAWFRQLTEHER
jgi:hypothetical protein